MARYQSRLLAYRAETVARTEANNAHRAAQRAMWEQAVLDGRMKAGLLRRTWMTARDERVRAAHRVMDGKVVGFDEPFDTPDQGLVMDPSAPNCRCIIWVQPDFLIKKG